MILSAVPLFAVDSFHHSYRGSCIMDYLYPRAAKSYENEADDEVKITLFP